MKRIENSNLTEDAVAKHESDLRSFPCGGSTAPSVYSTLSRSMLSVPTTPASGVVTIGNNPVIDEQARQNVTDLQKEMETLSVDEDDDLKSQAKTFATRFTTCSIPDFENFFNKINLQSKHQVEMLAFHAAVQEILREKKLPESTSSYFVAIIMFLDVVLKRPEQQQQQEDGTVLDQSKEVAAGLALLVRVIKSVPLTVLQARKDKFGAILCTVITKYQDSDNVQLLTHALGSLSILLRAQNLAVWYEDDQLKTWLIKILAFTAHQHPRIRKSGQYNVSAVLKGSVFMMTSPLRNTNVDSTFKMDVGSDDEEEEDQNEATALKSSVVNGGSEASGPEGKTLEIHPAAEFVADFLVNRLQSSGNLSNSNKTVLHTLVFTRQVIMTVPKQKLKLLLPRLLGLVSLGQGLVNTMVLQSLRVLCDAQPPPSVLPLTLTEYLLNSLTKQTPGVSSAIIAAPHDVTAVRAWSSVVTAAVQQGIRLDGPTGLRWCGDWCKMALNYWRSDNVQVLTAIEEAVSSVLGSVYDFISTENCKEHEANVRGILQHLEAALSYQFQGAWPCIFRLFGQCYSELGLYYAPLMMHSLRSLCELMANDGLASIVELERAVGKAIQGLGVEAVVFSAPVTVTGDISKDEKNLWLLPLLRKYVRGSRLVFYKDHFMPMAEKCFNVVSTMEADPKSNKRVLATYKTIEYQIWAMLPSFANQAQDVEEAQANKTFAKLVCRLIEHREASRIDAMAALRHMIVADSTTTGKLAKNASNYLPALFNIFLKVPRNSRNSQKEDVIEGSHRLAALATISAYLKILPQQQSENFMSAIITKYKDETTQHRKRALLNLIKCFVPHVNGEHIEMLYEVITPLITSAKDKREQKAAYRILEEVLGAESVGSVEFIDEHLPELEELLLQSVAKAAASSRAPRLRATKVVLQAVSSKVDPETSEAFLQRVVSESVVCCGRNNSTATRKAAFVLLAELPTAVARIKQLDEDKTVRECMRMLWGGLLGRDSVCANSIIAITAYTYQSKDSMPLDILEQNISNMCTLLECNSREVAQSCLSYIKGVVALYPVSVLGSVVKTIIGGIVSMTPDCARKYRLKTKSILARLMRKFGADHISSLVPRKHEILHRRIRNLRKEASRTRRQKEADELEEEQQREQEDGAEDLFTEKAPPTSLEEILAEIDPDLMGADEDDESNSKRKDSKRRKNKPTTAWLAEDDSDDEVLDLLAPNAPMAIMTKRPREVRSKDSSAKNKDDDEDDNGGFRVDAASGKLIILDNPKEDRLEKNANRVAVRDVEAAMDLKACAQSGKISNKRQRDHDSDEDSIDIPLPKRPKKKMQFDYGSEFRSKKGAGDVMRKGQTQKPFAYVPLSKDRLNRRKKAKFEGQFKAVVKGARKGASQGTKFRNSGKKNRS